MLQEIFSAVREPEVPICETGSRYEQFLESILTEAYLQILEPKVVIFSRKSDVEVVTKAAETATRSYKEISGRDIEFEVQGTISGDSCVSLAYLFISILIHSYYTQESRRSQTCQWYWQDHIRQYHGGTAEAT